MPIYNILCEPIKEGCGHKFELESLMKDLDTKFDLLICPECGLHSSLRQVYSPPIAHIPHTLGSLADKNSGEFSSDLKEHLTIENTKYKRGPNNWVSTKDGIKHIKQLEAEDRAKSKARKPVNKRKSIQKRKRGKK